jgi:hypothetical protein
MNVLLQTPTPDLELSLEFYRKLGFSTLEKDESLVVGADGLAIQVQADRFARAGLQLYRASWKEAVRELRKITEVLSQPYGYLLSDPSGVWLYLREATCPITKEDIKAESSVLGNFAGLSLETVDMAKSAQIYQTVGFGLDSGGPEQGWVSYKNDDGLAVSLMGPNCCPHLFINPSLTFFNGGKNLPVIAAIREAGIHITEEITHFNKDGIVDNVVLRDPGGFGIFVFND